MSGIHSASNEVDSVSDQALIERIRHGDSDSFALLMRRYNQRLFRVARAILRNDTEAEDVVQHAYVAAYTNLNQFSGMAAFSTWLTRIAINQALMRLRDQLRMRRLTADEAAPDWRSGTSAQRSPEESVAGGELARLLEKAIDSLPETYRAIVVLRELEGLNTQEAAECLSISEEAVRVRLHRARTLLREELWQRMGTTSCDVFSFGGERCARTIARVLAIVLASHPTASADP